jgi:hypothetical protein
MVTNQYAANSNSLSPHVLCAVDRNLYGHTSFGFSDSVSIPALTDMGYFCPTIQYLQVSVTLKAWSEQPAGQMAGATNAFQTPGVCIFLLFTLDNWYITF